MARPVQLVRSGCAEIVSLALLHSNTYIEALQWLSYRDKAKDCRVDDAHVAVGSQVWNSHHTSLAHLPQALTLVTSQNPI